MKGIPWAVMAVLALIIGADKISAVLGPTIAIVGMALLAVVAVAALLLGNLSIKHFVVGDNNTFTETKTEIYNIQKAPNQSGIRRVKEK